MTEEREYCRNENGIFVPTQPIEHRDEEYDPAAFDMLLEMQSRHFWYVGRHRLLLHVIKGLIQSRSVAGIDYGGGCGGWVRYLKEQAPTLFDELALADSSLRGLSLAADVVGPGVDRYQVDLLRLLWKDRWDIAFLLDVLEHIPPDVEALRQIKQTLKPGGYLIVTTPALKFFWSYNDDAAHHVRRYSKDDFRRLAAESGFELCLCRYFMFFLSPLLLLSRLTQSGSVKRMSPEQLQELIRRSHRIPSWPINSLLRFVFSLETPLGVWAPFPWGTSIVGVFRKID